MNRGKILILHNDNQISSYLLHELYVKGYFVSIVKDVSSALVEMKEKNFDLIISRCGMPEMEVRALLKEIKNIDPDSVIILISEVADPHFFEELVRLGAYDVISRPINLERFFLMIKKGIELHSIMVSHRKFMQGIEEQNTALQKQNAFLAKRVEELTKNLSHLYENLRSTYMRTIKALAQAIDMRDHYTHRHSENVSKYAVKIAKAMNLSEHEIEVIRGACELHDIGKIGIYDNILSKESPLTYEEREQIKLHSLKGAQILEPLNFLEETVQLVRQHHENYDGTGYPDGHRGEQIPLGARIIRLADAYDAMTSARAYRKNPLTKEEAIEEIKKNSGTQFDPKVVDAFLKIVDEL
ncbi:MAG: HD domain-containing protein [Candidatus Omnitrophica bacterium]|nr:HD domain-containing protein [Candidatus Omnitrophota bacterium]